MIGQHVINGQRRLALPHRRIRRSLAQGDNWPGPPLLSSQVTAPQHANQLLLCLAAGALLLLLLRSDSRFVVLQPLRKLRVGEAGVRRG